MSQTPSQQVSAARAIVRAARLLERASDELTLPQYRVLAAIASGEQRASRIAQKLALGKPAISSAVESLRQRGLLGRDHVDEDGRAATLTLTAEGRATLERVDAAMHERMGAVAAQAGDPAALLTALTALDAAINAWFCERQAEQGAQCPPRHIDRATP